MTDTPKLSNHVEYKLTEIAKRLGQDVADRTRSDLLASLEANPEHRISDVSMSPFRVFSDEEIDMLFNDGKGRDYDFPAVTPSESPSD